MKQPLVIYAGSTTEILDQLVIGPESKILPIPEGATLQLHVRPYDSSTELSLTGTPSVVDANTGRVKYEPTATDFPAAGNMRAWWRLIVSSKPLDLAEWDLLIGQHAQGLTTTMGMIARQAAAVMPTTWQKLRESAYVGDWALQNVIETNKVQFLRPEIYVPAAQEHELDPIALRWLARRSVLDLIPTGIDYWSNVRISASTPQEHASYQSKLESLRQLAQLLQGELEATFEEFQSIVGPYTRNAITSPKTDAEGIPMVTADPRGMPPAWGPFVPRVITRDYGDRPPVFLGSS